MAHSPQAFKRIRSSTKQRIHNESVLGEIKTLKKSFRLALGGQPAADSKEEKKPVDLKADARHLISRIDSAAQKGVIPRGRASRLKSRINTALYKAASAPAK